MQPFLVVGSDARTHATVLKLQTEGRSVTCSPGNAAIFIEPGVLMGNVPPSDHERLMALARESNSLTLVNPEGPLVAGIGDAFLTAELPFVGPDREGAQIEGSKEWCCRLLAEAGVPIPEFWIFDDPDAAIKHLEDAMYPLVIKANGLCSGKGVRIVQNFDEARRTVEDFMVKRIFNEAGSTIVVQEFLVGRELSMFAFVDRNGHVQYSILSRDYKLVGEGNTGHMTGGMGAHAPVPGADEDLRLEIIQKIFEPALAKLRSRGINYQGILYAGLILTDTGVKLLEFNCRLGDPEAEVILPLLETPLGEILDAIQLGDLDKLGKLQWHDGAACFVVMAAKYYPGKPVTGDIISGLNSSGQLIHVPEHPGEIYVLHGGTEFTDSVWRTKSGRVLGVCCVAKTHELAVQGAYLGVDTVNWRGEHHRPDIGLLVA